MTIFLKKTWWTRLSVYISAAGLGETMHNLLQNAGSSPFPWLWDGKQLSCACEGTEGAEQLWLLLTLSRAVGSTGLFPTPCGRGKGSAVLSQEWPSLCRLTEAGWPRSQYWRCGVVSVHHGALSTCSRQSYVHRIHSSGWRLCLCTGSPKRGAKRCIYIHCQGRERKCTKFWS